MTTIVYTSSQKKITLVKQIAHGGEAGIYQVQGQHNLLVKLYVPPIHPGYEPKVAWMKDHPPEEPDYSIDINEHKALAWPLDLLYNRKGKFVGYLMPRIRNAVTLLHVFNPRLRAQALPFDRKYLHRTARNLAAAIACLHDKGYVIGDLHESNAFVNPEALVTLVDTDSFQVHAAADGKDVCYRCVVGKPEYTAPELQGKRLADVIRKREHDCFALGVLVFQLLMNGNHPFRSHWELASEPPSLAEKISRGLFPHAKPPPTQVTPPPNTPSLDTLYPTLSTLMQRCFVDGHQDPHLRPTAAEWRAGLEEAETALVQCRKGHYYSNHLGKCPQCEANKRATRRARRATRTHQWRTVLSPHAWQAKQVKARQPRQAWLWVRSTFHMLTRQRWLQGVVIALFVIAMIYACINLIEVGPIAIPASTVTPIIIPAPSNIPEWYPRVVISPENAGYIELLAYWSGGYYLGDWTPDGEKLALFSQEGIHILDVQTLQQTLFIEDASVQTMAFSPKGTLLASGGSDYKLTLRETATGHTIRVIDNMRRYVHSVAFSPDGTLLASATDDRDQEMKVWEVATAREVYSFTQDWPGAVGFSPDGQYLVTAGGGPSIWELESGRKIAFLTIDDHKLGIYATDIVFSPDGSMLATWSSDNVRIWETSSWSLVHTLPGHQMSGRGMAFSPNGRTLASGGWGRRTKLWDVSTWTEAVELDYAHTGGHENVSSLAFSPDGTVLVIGKSNGIVELWGIPLDREIPLPTDISSVQTEIVLHH